MATRKERSSGLEVEKRLLRFFAPLVILVWSFGGFIEGVTEILGFSDRGFAAAEHSFFGPGLTGSQFYLLTVIYGIISLASLYFYRKAALVVGALALGLWVWNCLGDDAEAMKAGSADTWISKRSYVAIADQSGSQVHYDPHSLRHYRYRSVTIKDKGKLERI